MRIHREYSARKAFIENEFDFIRQVILTRVSLVSTLFVRIIAQDVERRGIVGKNSVLVALKKSVK